MAATGLDSVSLAFRPASESYFDALLAKPHRSSKAGGVVFLEPGPGETKMGAFPSYGLVYVEGRADAMLTDSSSSWALRSVGELPSVAKVAEVALGFLAGRPVQGPCEVRRVDFAHELEFDDWRDGLSFLKTVAGMSAPRRKTWPAINGGTIETVYFRQAKSNVVTERIYDKGVESGSHRAGERIRIEAQRRPAKAQRYSPEVFAREVDVSAEFGRSIIPSLASEKIVSAGLDGAVSHLAGAACRAELGMAKAERLIGTVAIMREYGRAFYPDVQQQQRRLRGLREAGVSLDDALPPDRVVPVGQLLRQAVEAFDV